VLIAQFTWSMDHWVESNYFLIAANLFSKPIWSSFAASWHLKDDSTAPWQTMRFGSNTHRELSDTRRCA
jgi:hypothetical protein